MIRRVHDKKITLRNWQKLALKKGVNARNKQNTWNNKQKSSIWATNFIQDYSWQKGDEVPKFKHNKAMVKNIQLNYSFSNK